MCKYRNEVIVNKYQFIMVTMGILSMGYGYLTYGSSILGLSSSLSSQTSLFLIGMGVLDFIGASKSRTLKPTL